MGIDYQNPQSVKRVDITDVIAKHAPQGRAFIETFDQAVWPSYRDQAVANLVKKGGVSPESAKQSVEWARGAMLSGFQSGAALMISVVRAATESEREIDCEKAMATFYSIAHEIHTINANGRAAAAIRQAAAPAAPANGAAG